MSWVALCVVILCCRHSTTQMHHAERGYNAVQFQGAANSWVRGRQWRLNWEICLSPSCSSVLLHICGKETCWEGRGG